jgi:hypothetical protein
MKDEDLQKVLRVMKRDGGKFIEIYFINGKEVYSVNVEKIVSKMKIRHVAKIIERKYDLIAGRIFRILKKHKHLNEKAVMLLFPRSNQSNLFIKRSAIFLSKA